MRVAREQRHGGDRGQERREGRSSAGCGVDADRGRDGRCGKNANLQRTLTLLCVSDGRWAHRSFERHIRKLFGDHTH